MAVLKPTLIYLLACIYFTSLSYLRTAHPDLGVLSLLPYYILFGSFPEVAPDTYTVCKSQALLLGLEYGKKQIMDPPPSLTQDPAPHQGHQKGCFLRRSSKVELAVGSREMQQCDACPGVSKGGLRNSPVHSCALVLLFSIKLWTATVDHKSSFHVWRRKLS